MKVKICGIQSEEEAQAAVAQGADALGFVFASSPRRLSPTRAREIIRLLPPTLFRVGVFVDQPREEVAAIAELCNLNVLQFHGEEPPAYCRGWKGYYVIKAFRVRGPEFLGELERYKVDAYLLDAYVPGVAGGTGKTLNWEFARQAQRPERFLILAGGLTPENVSQAVAFVQPDAVDVSSGVETAGYKDGAKIAAFIRAAKNTFFERRT